MLPIIIAVAVSLAVVSVLVLVSGGHKSSSSKRHGAVSAYGRNRAQVIRECTKKLAKDPHNIQALKTLGELYFTEHMWEKALPIYDALMTLSAAHIEINAPEACLRHGICCLKQKKVQEALKSLITAYKLDPSNFEVNFYLGKACFENKDYEKAIPCFKKAYTINPEAIGITSPLGMALYKGKKFKESLPVLRKALDENPQDKELLFSMADAMLESGLGNKALKVFLQMRPDPVYGPRASLAAGVIHTRMGMTEDAIHDYEIGLKLKDIPQDTMLELNYRLAQCYFSVNKIAPGLGCLTRINAVATNYKDVNALLARYKELNQNTNLQIYLSSGTSDFVALCRNLVTKFYPNAHVKIADVEVQQDTVEIQCEVVTPKWEDIEMFRFYKISGTLGELSIRDFHAKIRDRKIDKGFCITPGVFSEEAHKFVDGRPIDLIEKEKLMQYLKKITL